MARPKEKKRGESPKETPLKSNHISQQIREVPGESEERYRLIVDTACEGIWVLDADYVAAFVNRRMADMLGYEPEEIVGRRHDFFMFPEDLPDLEEKTSRRRQGIGEEYERRFRRKDGSTLWVHASASPILDGEGLFRGSFAMFTDITEARHTEEALLESEAKYRSIFENAVEGIFQSTPEGRLITVNPAMARIFGYSSPAEMVSLVTNIGRQIYTNTEYRGTFTRLLEDHGIIEAFEAEFYRQDGTVLWGSLNVRAVRDGGGTILYFQGTLEDITARKMAEEALKQSEEKYRDIFENALEGMFQITPDGRYLSANPALARIHGFNSPREMVESVTDIAHQLYVDPSRRTELKSLMEKEGMVRNFEIMMRRKDLSLHWVSVTSRAIRDASGNILYYEGTLEDITSRKFAEEELKQLKKSLAGTLGTMSSVVEMREPGIAGHHERVAKIAGDVATEMGLAANVIESIRTAGIIHDVGKISIPVEILSKPITLTEAELNLVKGHPRSGYMLFKDSELPHPVAQIIHQHHERLNGSGYPLGLKGTEILMEARILAVADVVEAMTSSRPYRPACSIDITLEELKRNRGILYDPEAVDACLRLFKKGYVHQ